MTSSVGAIEFSDTPPSSEREAEQLIEKIRKYRQGQSSKTPDAESRKLRRMQDRILESLDDASHVIPELLQNADDVGGNCTRAILRLTDEALVVENHNECMSEAEVAALGEFTRSTKRDLSYIGHFGIGFKTVFSLTDSPHIQTGHVSFKYNRSLPEQPVLVDEEHVNGTRIRLPFTDGLSETRRDALREKLESIDRLLPFLNNLKSIHVELDGETSIYERDVIDDNIITIYERSSEDDSPETIAQYRLFTQTLSTDSEVFEMLADEREIDATDLEDRNVGLDISIMIPVDDDGAPSAHPESRLFCYFPASEKTLLPFDVQADFLLKSDRDQIRPGHQLNERFLTAAGELFETAISEFQAKEVSPETLLELIPDFSKDRPTYLNPLLKQTKDAVSHKQLIPTAAGDLCKPTELVILPRELRSVLPLTEFARTYPEANAHPKEDLADDYYECLRALDSTQVLSITETLEHLSGTNIPQEIKVSEIIEILAAVGSYIDSLRSFDSERDEIKTALKSLPVFSFQGRTELDGRHSLTEIGENVYRPARQDESVYEPFYDELDLLSGDLVAELRSNQTIQESTAGQVQDLLADQLGIEKLTHKDIVSDVINEAFKPPIELPDSTLDDYLEYIIGHAQKHLDSCEIRLRRSNGNYAEPETLYLPTEYNEDRYRSTLLFGTLTDKKPVCDSYINQSSENIGVDEWRSLFVELGVQNHIPVYEDPDQCTKETFDSADEMRDFLSSHNDEGTEVRNDKDTTEYKGYGCSWMKSSEACHGLVDYAFSSTFEQRFEEELNSTPELGDEFIKMLNICWKESYQKFAYRDYCYSVRDNGFAIRTEKSRCPTTFTSFLRSNEWFPGDDGELHRPNHLFRHNSLTKRADVTLIDTAVKSISRDLLDLLEVREDVGITEHRIGIEKAVGERTEENVDDVDSEIRRRLHSLAEQIDDASNEERSQLVDDLQDCSFIHIPDADPEFRTLQQVAWGEGLGEYIVPIKTYYRGLHGLFVEELGIPPEPTLETYLEFFQYANTDRWSAIDDAWTELIRRLIRDNSSDRDASEIAMKLQETDAIPNVNKSIVSYDEIEYIARREGTAERLPKEITNSVALSNYDKRLNRDEIVDLLTTIVNATPLEEAMERTIKHPEYQQTGQTLYEDFTQCLEVGNSVLRDREGMKAAERLESIAEYTLQITPQVKCEYRIKGNQRVSVDEETVYIDEEESHVILKNSEAARLDLVDALAATLDLTNADKNAFVGFVKGAVGKPEGLIDAYLNGENISRVSIAVDTSTNNEPDESERLLDPVEEQTSESEHRTGQSIEQTLTTEDSTQKTTGEKGRTRVSSIQSENKNSNLDLPSSDERLRESDTNEKSHRDKQSWNRSEKSKTANDDTNTSSPTSTTRDTANQSEKRAKKIGREGEKFVIDHIKDLISEAFDSKPTIDEFKHGFRLTGQYHGTDQTIYLEFIPDKSDPHCDILVTGASLQRKGDTLSIESIDNDEQALIEVKSTETTNRTFVLTGLEHRDAQNYSDRYFIVRVVEALKENPKVEKVFDSVPRVETNKIADDRLKIERYMHELTLSY